MQKNLMIKIVTIKGRTLNVHYTPARMKYLKKFSTISSLEVVEHNPSTCAACRNIGGQANGHDL